MTIKQKAVAAFSALAGMLPVAALASAAPPGFGPECSRTALVEPITDPLRWSALCFSRTHGATGADPATLRSFQLDIDGDASPELFVGSTVASGHGGGPHYVFRRNDKTYSYLGELALHPDAVRSLSPSRHRAPVLLIYRRVSADQGDLEWVTYDGQRFAPVHSERIYPNGRDKQLYCAIFECL